MAPRCATAWPETCSAGAELMTPLRPASEAQRSLLVSCSARQGCARRQSSVREVGAKKGVPIARGPQPPAYISERDLAALMAATLRLRQIDLTAVPLRSRTGARAEGSGRHSLRGSCRCESTAHIEVAPQTRRPRRAQGRRVRTGKRVKAVVASARRSASGLAHVYRLQESLDAFPCCPFPTSRYGDRVARPGQRSTSRSPKEAGCRRWVKLAAPYSHRGIKAAQLPCTSSPHRRGRGSATASTHFEESSASQWGQQRSSRASSMRSSISPIAACRRRPHPARYSDRVRRPSFAPPAQHGEKITLRILDAATVSRPLVASAFQLQRSAEDAEAIANP